MATQTTPHTNTGQNQNSAEADLEPNMNPEDTYRADPKLYENSDGAQTGGTRAFNANAERDNQPKSLDEGTANTGPNTPVLPQENATGVTTHSGNEERAQQEKVINS